jgi:hypothetical protein
MPKMKSAEQDPTFSQLETEIDKERSKGNTLSARFVRLATLMALHCQDEKTTHDGWKATLLAGRIRIPPYVGCIGTAPVRLSIRLTPSPPRSINETSMPGSSDRL